MLTFPDALSVDSAPKPQSMSRDEEFRRCRPLRTRSGPSVCTTGSDFDRRSDGSLRSRPGPPVGNNVLTGDGVLSSAVMIGLPNRLETAFKNSHSSVANMGPPQLLRRSIHGSTPNMYRRRCVFAKSGSARLRPSPGAGPSTVWRRRERLRTVRCLLTSLGLVRPLPASMAVTLEHTGCEECFFTVSSSVEEQHRC